MNTAKLAKSEGKLDQSIYDDPDAGMLDTHEAVHIPEHTQTKLEACITAASTLGLDFQITPCHTRLHEKRDLHL